MNMIKEKIKSNEALFQLAKNYIYYRQMIRYKFYPESAVKRAFKKFRGVNLDLKNPKTLSEKLMYINLYNQHELATQLADKYSMREYIKEKGYKNLLVDLLGVYNNANEIDFDKLPKQFVLKCTHGCGYNIICKDKSNLDIKKTRQQLTKWMKENFAYYNIEKHYEKIKPRIICEKYINDLSNEALVDYKLYCMNGKYILTQCCTDRENKVKLAYYDKEWNKLDYSNREIDKNIDVLKPKNHNKMIEIATELSKPFDYVRVDFYETKDGLMLGELTFTPAACSLDISKEANEKLGKLLTITSKRKVS